jgi:hypothetical protein
MMKVGKFFKGLLIQERRVAALAALMGVNVHGVPIGELQQQGEQIGGEVAGVVKQFKKPDPVPPSAKPPTA